MGHHFQRGQVLFDLRRYAEAIEEYQLELADNATDFYSHCNIAASLANLGKHREAERSVRTAIELNPQFAHAHYLLSCLHLHRGNYRKAIRTGKEALRLSHSAEYFYHLANIHAQRGRDLRALSYTSSALEHDPAHVDTLLLRSKLLSQLGRYAEADELLHVALAAEPANPLVHHAFGQSRLDSGPATTAYRELTEARRLDPLKANDIDAIANAHGRLLGPFSLLEKRLPRWHVWPSKRRWLLFMTTGAFLTLANILSGYSLEHSKPSLSWSLFCALVANALAIPYTLNELATATAKLIDPRQFDSKYTRFVYFPAILCWISLIHFFASIVGYYLLTRTETCAFVFGLSCSFSWLNQAATDVIKFAYFAFLFRMALILMISLIGVFGLGSIANGDVMVGLATIPPFMLLTYFADELNARVSHLR